MSSSEPEKEHQKQDINCSYAEQQSERGISVEASANKERPNLHW